MIMVILFFLCSIISTHLLGSMQKMVITKPVVSVWIQPYEDKPTHGLPLLHDFDIPNHNTQLVADDRVLVFEEKKANGWIKIQAIDQPAYYSGENRWGFCEGWILADSGTKVDDFPLKPVTIDESLPVDLLRIKLVEYAKTLLASPYCWGGASVWNKETTAFTSFDCSGLVYHVYQKFFLSLPRNSHAQWIGSVPIEPHNLQPGDLVFLKYARGNYARVGHVMMYIGGENLIETLGVRGDGLEARYNTFLKKFGVEKKNIVNGIRYNNYEVHCSSYLSNQNLLEFIKKRWLDPFHKAISDASLVQHEKGKASQ